MPQKITLKDINFLRVKLFKLFSLKINKYLTTK